MKKKVYLLTIATALTLSVTACGNKSEETQEPTDTTVVEVADLESTIVEENTVTELTVVEEPTTVEELTSSEETTEPTIVEEETSSEEEEFEPYTAEDIAEWGEAEKDYIMGTYKFLCHHNSDLKETDDLLEALNTGVIDRVTTEELLALVNEDFSKAYDIIEECGLDVVTDEGKELKASKMRAEVTDYDTFFELLGDITNYTGEIAEARGVYTEATKSANSDAEKLLAEGISETNMEQAQEVHTKLTSNLAMYDQYTAYIDGLNAAIDHYNTLIHYLH